MKIFFLLALYLLICILYYPNRGYYDSSGVLYVPLLSEFILISGVCWLAYRFLLWESEEARIRTKELLEKQKELNKKRYFCPSCFTELRSKTQETCHQCNKKINESINYFDLPEDYKITL